MNAANDNRASDAPAYWLDRGRIMTGGLLGARFIEPAEAHQLAGHYSRQAITLRDAGHTEAARYCARRGVALALCIETMERAA